MPLSCDNAVTREKRLDFVDVDGIKITGAYPGYDSIDHVLEGITNLELRERLTPLSTSGPGSGGDRCAGCRLPWDKGKRRRLLEACGHSRCAACTARTTACPQCAPRARALHRTRHAQHSSTDTGSDDESPLRTRLGVLLGGARRRGRAGRRPRPSAAVAGGAVAAGTGGANVLQPRTAHASMLSLVSLDVSPVSTLTGSSEADVAVGAADLSRRTAPDSLPSISPSPAGSFCSHLSRSLTTSQDDNDKYVGSPVKYRKYDQDFLKHGNEYYQHSSATNNGSGFRNQLPLKPLYFEVAQSSREPFVGRAPLLSRLECWINNLDEHPALMVSGPPGAGKTSLVLQLVERSCFGRGIQTDSSRRDVDLTLDRIASHVVGYHFCQADNSPTCQRGELVHSVAAQLCQAPGMIAYRRLLADDLALLSELSPQACASDPINAFNKGIIQPLASLHAAGVLPAIPGLILIDALCEADYHRPEAGDSLGDFLLRIASLLPPCLRFLMTRRNTSIVLPLPKNMSHLSLDAPREADRDVLEYVALRMQSDALKANVKSPTGKSDNFAQYVTSLARGSFLFAKLVLDLCESGLIVLKASNYKVIPVTLAQIFTLQFNVRFPTAQSFEKISHILSVCLASLYPLTEDEIYASVNSLLVDQFLPPVEFRHRMSSLKGFLVKRSDGTNVFFHPAFREWLVRRDAGDADKFLCDLRAGHAALAFKLSRMNAPLDAGRTQELAHHALKAHPFKEASGNGVGRDLLAAWIADTSSSTTSALVDLRNAYCPNARVSRLLLLSGAIPDTNVEVDAAPLACVWAARGETAALCALLDAQASVDSSDALGRTALSHAAREGYEEAARALVSAGADPAAVDSAGLSPLAYAAQGGHGELVSLLLAAERDTPAALTALVIAAATGNKEIVSILVEAVDTQVDSACPVTGRTALTAACSSVDSAESGVVEILLSADASVDRADARGLRAVTCTAMSGSLIATEGLLNAGAQACYLAGDSTPPLVAAAAQGHTQILLLLINHGADFEKPDQSGRGPLWWACANGHSEAALSLLAAGAPADIPFSTNNQYSARPLIACRSPATAEILMHHGADPERVDVNGARLIDKHVVEGNLPMISCLLKKGVKLGPNTWSKAEGKPQIIGILVNKLLDDGNALYRRGEMSAAAHRYNYALRHLPLPQGQQQQSNQHLQYLIHLKANLLLNLARCKRKLNEPSDALELAISGASLRPLCWEGWYGVARAARAFGDASRASGAARRALALLSPQASPHIASALHALIKEGT